MNFLKVNYYFLAFLANCSLALSQKLEFGLGGGISHFKGDISPNFNPLQLGVGVNGLFRYNLSRSVTLRGQLLFTSYQAKDENTNDPLYLRRLYVAEGTILEGSAVAEYNFLDKGKLVKGHDWTPYLFGGIGYAFVKNKSGVFNANSFGTIVLPYGVGVKYRFKGPFSVGAEFGARYTLSDKLDQIYYVSDSNPVFLGPTNPTTLLNALDGKIKFGDTTRKDQYYFTSITLTYTIFNLICPD